MRRTSTSPSIQLFPFLAVLVCAMGALILLLLVTTRKMRQVAVARAEAEAAEAEDAARPAIRPAPKPVPVPVPSGPTPEELAAREAERAARRDAITMTRKRQAAREREWQRSLAEAQIALDQRRQRVAETQQELDQLREKLQATETNLQHLIDRKSQLKSDLDNDAKLRAKIEREHAELSAAIVAAQKKLADLRRTHADRASKFAFIPYDGASGTTRRPVYIECTSTGIRFQPENALLDENDLKGFTESFNPLLVASQRLMQYWREQAIAVDDPRQVARPYILLVVRPKGTISYYVARKMLSNLGDDFGYELIEDDFQLQLPPADPLAKAVIQRAIADTLRNRGEMIAAGGRVGEPRLGEVLIGRSEDVIEFGSLDDQIAATIHRDENPFKKNSGGQGKSFAITRSPVHKDEVSAGAFKSSLAERDRERRRAQGVPDSLVDMAGRGNPYGSPATGARTGVRGNGGTRSPGVAVADSSRSGGMAGGSSRPQKHTLGDPFSREHLATGRNGPGTADFGSSEDERTASNNSGSPDQTGTGRREAGSTSGQTGSRLQSRGNSGLPNGAKVGKIIEIPNAVSPIGDGTESTGTGTGTRFATRGVPPGGKVSTDGQNSTGSDSDGGGGDPGSGGDSLDPTAPRGPRTPSAAGQRDSMTGKPGTGPRSARNAPGDSGSDSIPEDADTAFRKPQPPEGNSTQSGTTTGRGRPSQGSAGSRGPGGDIKTRSTDPNLEQPRQYGDNPEARKQLAASKSASVMQKREAARRRWGGSNTGQIGFERKVLVEVTGDRIFVERNDIEVVIEPGTSQEELVEAVLSALDEHSLGWGKPPTKFYWVPYVNFEVYGAGAAQYERLNSPLREWGIFSEVEFKAGDRPAQVPNTNGVIQPVAESKDPQNTSIKSTKQKPTGPVEDPAQKTKKSPFNWFRKLGGRS